MSSSRAALRSPAPMIVRDLLLCVDEFERLDQRRQILAVVELTDVDVPMPVLIRRGISFARGSETGHSEGIEPEVDAIDRAAEAQAGVAGGEPGNDYRVQALKKLRCARATAPALADARKCRLPEPDPSRTGPRRRATDLPIRGRLPPVEQHGVGRRLSSSELAGGGIVGALAALDTRRPSLAQPIWPQDADQSSDLRASRWSCGSDSSMITSRLRADPRRSRSGRRQSALRLLTHATGGMILFDRDENAGHPRSRPNRPNSEESDMSIGVHRQYLRVIGRRRRCRCSRVRMSTPACVRSATSPVRDDRTGRSLRA